MKTIVSYGGGTNSTAILVGLYERGIRPDGITFADTGGEKPNTYEHIKAVNAWCVSVGFPEIEVLRGPKYWGPQMVIDGGLYEENIRLGSLPSKAYGFGKCSLKWKVEPQARWLREFARQCNIELTEIVSLVGFDADEPERADRAIRMAEAAGNKQPWKKEFPLIEWGWGREECVEAIARAGLPQPGKSACYFCPSSKKHEILKLRTEYADLFAKAVEMERRALAGEGPAPATNARGLGRSFSWAQFVVDADAFALLKADFKDRQYCLFSDAGTPEIDCGCYDG